MAFSYMQKRLRLELDRFIPLPQVPGNWHWQRDTMVKIQKQAALCLEIIESVGAEKILFPEETRLHRQFNQLIETINAAQSSTPILKEEAQKEFADRINSYVDTIKQGIRDMRYAFDHFADDVAKEITEISSKKRLPDEYLFALSEWVEAARILKKSFLDKEPMQLITFILNISNELLANPPKYDYVFGIDKSARILGFLLQAVMGKFRRDTFIFFIKGDSVPSFITDYFTPEQRMKFKGKSILLVDETLSNGNTLASTYNYMMTAFKPAMIDSAVFSVLGDIRAGMRRPLFIVSHSNPSWYQHLYEHRKGVIETGDYLKGQGPPKGADPFFFKALFRSKAREEEAKMQGKQTPSVIPLPTEESNAIRQTLAEAAPHIVNIILQAQAARAQKSGKEQKQGQQRKVS